MSDERRPFWHELPPEPVSPLNAYPTIALGVQPPPDKNPSLVMSEPTSTSLVDLYLPPDGLVMGCTDGYLFARLLPAIKVRDRVVLYELAFDDDRDEREQWVREGQVCLADLGHGEFPACAGLSGSLVTEISVDAVSGESNHVKFTLTDTVNDAESTTTADFVVHDSAPTRPATRALSPGDMSLRDVFKWGRHHGAGLRSFDCSRASGLDSLFLSNSGP